MTTIPSVGCFELDQAGRYVGFDPQHEASLHARGWPGPRKGVSCLDALGAEVGEDGRAHLTRALTEVRQGSNAEVVLGAGGQALAMRLHPRVTGDGQVVGAIGVHAVDWSGASGPAEGWCLAVEKLADGVVNELNNLGVGLEGVNEGLRGDVGDRNGSRELLENVRSRAKAAHRLVRSIRSQVMPAPTQRFAIDTLLTELEPRLRQLGPGGAWSTDLGAQGLAVLADPEELGDALGELVRNSVEAGAHQIKMRTRPTSSGGVQIELADDGEGISPELLRKAFELYAGSRKHAQGIGLPRARSVIQRHGGQVALESAPGQGTVARIELPALRNPEVVADADSEADKRPLNVFVVDDAPEVRRVLGRVLRHAGHEVAEAEDGVDALEKLDARPRMPDVVILDLMMPRMDGVETYRALRSRAGALPILITSGYHPSSLGFLATDPRASFLPKPFSPAEVITALDNLMDA